MPAKCLPKVYTIAGAIVSRYTDAYVGSTSRFGQAFILFVLGAMQTVTDRLHFLQCMFECTCTVSSSICDHWLFLCELSHFSVSSSVARGNFIKCLCFIGEVLVILISTELIM